jgi:pimeloyl-ACP methyl ester carboxylesterase
VDNLNTRTESEIPSTFKSPELSEDYFRIYDKMIAEWPVPHEGIDVTTSFGLTHINVAGPRGADVVLLVPGFGANSAMWFANIGALSQCYRVMAVDTIGQPGKSIPARQLTADTTTTWLSELLRQTSLSKVRMIRVSLGGWITLDFTLKHPEMIVQIALLDPAATFAPMSVAFLLHSLLPVMIHPTRRGLQRYFKWLTRGKSVNKDWGELMIQGILNRKPQPPIRAKPFSDAQLSSCRSPVLLIVGQQSVIYNPQRVIERAKQLIPQVQAEVISDASHGLKYEQADLVNSRILRFFVESG